MRKYFLFITRNYPPMIGGLETYSYHLIREFEKRHTVFKITLGKSRIHLLWFLPACLFLAFFLINRYSIGYVHLCDGVLSPVGILIKRFTRVPVTVSVHGLDVTHRRSFFQWLIPRCLSRMDTLICVSRSTRHECIRRGISKQICRVIPNGIDPDVFKLSISNTEKQRILEIILPAALKKRKLLLSVGRLVERKGICWFVEHVMPKLIPSYCYIVAGEGPDLHTLRSVIRASGLSDCVFLLGRVTDRTRKLLYHIADIFIMPNIECGDDVEGFGIAAIEAGSCGLPVVASNLQGLRDAVIEGWTGYLVRPGEAQGFIDRITSMNLQKQSIQTIVNAQFNWTTVSDQYYDVITNN
jgi:phosphatidylinositol alpha-1,6-mannosyltransferase